jgi:Zn-dependent metalloprotease
MKKIFLVFGIVLIVMGGIYWFLSNDSVIRVQKGIDHSISSQELSQIKEFFIKNDLNINNLEFHAFNVDQFGNTHLRANQFYGDVPIFSNDLTIHFDKNGKFTSLIGDRVDKVNIILEPKVTMNEAFNTFRKYTGTGLVPIKNVHSFTGELGIYDLNAGVSYTEPNFVMAWFFKPIIGGYPMGYVNAYTGEKIYFDDGVRF